MQNLQQQNAQLQEQLAMITAELQAAPEAVSFQRDDQGNVTGATKSKKPKNMLPDGSQVGGREGNTMASRPNGV
jgi:hypothetical protein